MLVSCRIYWKVANNDGTNKSRSLLDFRNGDSLKLSRLCGGSWNNVNGIVKVEKHRGKPRITVSGLLHGRERRRSLLLPRKVELEIVTDASTHEKLLNQIRALIVP